MSLPIEDPLMEYDQELMRDILEKVHVAFDLDYGVLLGHEEGMAARHGRDAVIYLLWERVKMTAKDIGRLLDRKESYVKQAYVRASRRLRRDSGFQSRLLEANAKLGAFVSAVH